MNLLLPECQLTLWVAIMGGAAMGTTVTLLVLAMILFHQTQQQMNLSTMLRFLHSPALAYAEDKRQRLPKTIILVRHGESEANADEDLWKKIPDNLLGLTNKGREQAKAVGKRVELVLSSNDDDDDHSRIHLVVSPFERTLQTASCLRPAIEHRIVRTDIDSRIREQEMGNMQDCEEFQKYRQEQMKVGRFWYRYISGESGADVLDRVKSWWFESVLTVNERVGVECIDAMVVVTHGLAMRFILMQLFGWSPTTFHSVFNADNCDMYVLRKDLSKVGPSPYVLDKEHGDMPRSSIDVVVKLKSTGKEIPLTVEDYLSIPPPRTTRVDFVKHMLATQHPNIVSDANDIASILLMPFIVEDGGEILGRSGVAESNNSDFRKHHRRKSSAAWEHCQFSCVSSTSDVSESDDRLCNCSSNGIATTTSSPERQRI